MPGSIDATVESLLAGLPGAEREVARALPHHLGLCREERGRWDDFVTLPPNRDLPVFAAEWPEAPPWSAEGVARFSRAHHLAAVWNLVADRLIDRQVLRTEALIAQRRLFLRAWVDELDGALGAPELARSLVCGSVVRWRAGVRVEQRAARARAMSLEDYLTSVRLKLHWVGTSAVAMHTQNPFRHQALRSAAGLLLLSCQLRDDALDEHEDQATRGLGTAAMLGVHPAVLFRAAPRVARAAQSEADRGGFVRLGCWLRGYAGEVDQRFHARDPSLDESAAARLATALVLLHLSTAS